MVIYSLIIMGWVKYICKTFVSRFASNKCCLRDVGERFGIGISTCFYQIVRVMEYLVSVAPKYIHFPKTEDEKEYMSREFEQVRYWKKYET